MHASPLNQTTPTAPRFQPRPGNQLRVITSCTTRAEFVAQFAIHARPNSLLLELSRPMLAARNVVVLLADGVTPVIDGVARAADADATELPGRWLDFDQLDEPSQAMFDELCCTEFVDPLTQRMDVPMLERVETAPPFEIAPIASGSGPHISVSLPLLATEYIGEADDTDEQVTRSTERIATTAGSPRKMPAMVGAAAAYVEAHRGPALVASGIAIGVAFSVAMMAPGLAPLGATNAHAAAAAPKAQLAAALPTETPMATIAETAAQASPSSGAMAVTTGVPAPCTASVNSAPHGATVTWNGERLGVTPLRNIRVPCGNATVRWRLGRHRTVSRSVTAQIRTAAVVFTRLHRARRMLRLRSVPAGATFLVNGKRLRRGTSSIYVNTFRTATVTAKRAGYKSRTLRVRMGHADRTVRIRLATKSLRKMFSSGFPTIKRPRRPRRSKRSARRQR